MSKIECLTLHNAIGECVLANELTDWASKQMPWRTFDTTKYSWTVNGERHEREKSGYWCELPDASGFICFETGWRPDNCVLLDAYGRERIRLSVPWQLTRQRDPRSAEPPTSFDNVSMPYANPSDGQLGEFGVTAWVEHAGKYYFEIDYRTGRFLWGKEVRD